MAFFISIISFLLFFAGCATHTPKDVNSVNSLSSNQEIKAFKESSKNGNVPPMVLPPIYENISVFDDKKISLSAQEAKLSNILYQVSKQSGLNLIIDKDVDINMPITLSVQGALLLDTLDVIMNISGCYYKLSGNILHVKQFEQKNFFIPYVHISSSFKTKLGGDTGAKGSTDASSGLNGDFKLIYDNPSEINNFYEQLEKNIASLLSPDGKYTLNKFTGTLNVYDKKKNIEAIESVVEKIKKQSGRQVLIEAKILEIILNDDHSLGVSWEAVSNSIIRNGDSLQLSQTLGLSTAVAGSVNYNAKNFSSIISALAESGDVDTLSNPSINVLSGQSAMISSGKLIPFWEKEVQTTQGTGGSASTSEVTYTRRDVLDGVTLGVTPTVMENGKIMLNIIPITSSIEEVVSHFDENGKSVASAPILNIKEAGTVIYAMDNDLVLIGGLINNTTSKQENKVPLLGDIPLLGSLFTKTLSTDEKRELVILIRLKIIE